MVFPSVVERARAYIEKGMHRKRSRGFVLLMMAVGMVLGVGLAGLTIDLARLYIAKNELQAAADAAALAGAYELDGTFRGLERAAAQVTSSPNRWNFGTEPPVVEITFASALDGHFASEPASAEAVRYLRVRARAQVPAFFIPGAAQRLEALASAGQMPAAEMADHWVQNATEALDLRHPDFGYQRGEVYPLRPVEIAAGIGPHYEEAVRRAIVNGVEGRRMAAGDRVAFTSGDAETEATAFEERFAQDTDTTARSYEEYAGNGRRFVVLPVSDPASGTVAGFAGFFLRPGACGEQQAAPCQAEYVGAAVLPGRRGAGPAGVYRVTLVE